MFATYNAKSKFNQIMCLLQSTCVKRLLHSRPGSQQNVQNHNKLISQGLQTTTF